MERFTRSLIFEEYPKNPILSPEEWPYPAVAVFNPGTVELNGEVFLLVRVEDFRGFSHLTIARSKDGISKWEIDKHPTLIPDPNFEEEMWGLEDPRIVFLKDREEYAITYTSFSAGGPVISIILTKDFKNFTRHGTLVPPEDKDGALFPVTFNGRYALIHRPIIRGDAHIWISFSPDLEHWGEHHVLLPVRPGLWDCHRVGLGPPPIETEEGWLIIYHGVRQTASGALYRVGLALLDLENPIKVIKRSEEWVVGPSKESGIIFPNGVVLKEDTLYLYYGINDLTVGLSFASKRKLLDYLLNS